MIFFFLHHLDLNYILHCCKESDVLVSKQQGHRRLCVLSIGLGTNVVSVPMARNTSATTGGIEPVTLYDIVHASYCLNH